jgi:chromosomal replication initiator protein
MREETFVPLAEVESIWQQCLQTVKEDSEHPVWQACLNDMVPLALEDNVFRLATGHFSADMLTEDPALTKNLTRDLAQTLQRIIGRDIELEFINQDYTSNGTSRAMTMQQETAAPATYHNNNTAGEFVSSGLNPKYTFYTFVEGSSNQLAYAAARSVSENPARSYNPLFLYGGVGLGKTHLMQAIGHGILERNPNARVVYVSTETFMNDLIESLGNKRTASFREKYRNVDVLLIDDIQFLINKERTQEEFFHTFNNLHSSNRQIVITSDHPPHELHPLEDRLRSRFTQGLIADIQSPDIETREAILRKKVAEQYQVNVPLDVISFIAERFPSSIRDLEGAMIRVIAFASTHGMPIDMNTASEALQQILPDIRARSITIRTIQQKVCEHFRIKLEELTGERRDHRFAFPRQVAMFLSRDLTTSSLKQIADEFGGKHHTTVIHAIRQIERNLTDPSTKENVECIKEVLKDYSG